MLSPTVYKYVYMQIKDPYHRFDSDIFSKEIFSNPGRIFMFAIWLSGNIQAINICE
jgi:hypothetical protein